MQSIFPTDVPRMAQRARVEIAQAGADYICYAVDLAPDDADALGISRRIDMIHVPGEKTYGEYRRRLSHSGGEHQLCEIVAVGDHGEYQDRLDWLVAACPAYYALCAVLADLKGPVPYDARYAA